MVREQEAAAGSASGLGGSQSVSFQEVEVFALWSHSHVSEPFSLGWHHLEGLQRNLSAVIGSARAGTKAVSLAVVSFCVPYVTSLLHKQCGNCREPNNHYAPLNGRHYTAAIITLITKVAL